MATSTVLTNKPINPRGDDNRPVDSYNRASLYSGKALDFDGVNDYVDGGTLDITAYTQMSMSFYFKAHSTTSDWRLISIRYSGSDDIRIFHATSIGAGKLSFALDDGTPVTFSEDFTKNEWYHVVMTHDGTTLKAYFNGVLVQSAASDFNYSGTNGLFYIGRYTGGTFSYYDGEFANYKLFNTALTAAQVADLYNNPEKVVPTGVDNTALKLWLPMMEGAGTTAYDGSGNGNHGTISGATYVNGVGAPVAQSAVIDWNKGVNLQLKSEDLTSATGWLFDALTTSADQTTAPDGQSTADELTETTSSTSHWMYTQTGVLTTVSSSDYTFSVFAKKGDGSAAPDILQLSFRSAGHGSSAYANFNLSTGVVTASNGGTASIVAHSNGWYRLIFTAAATASAAGSGGVIAFTNNNATATRGPSYVGDTNANVFVWGASLTQSSSADSYVRVDDTAQPTPVLLPQGLTSGRDITGVNLFENVRKQGALNLDGNSWAEVHDNASLDFGTGSFTLEAWIKGKFVSQGSVFNMVISLGGNITSSNNAGLMVLNNTVPYFIYSNPGALTGSAQTEGDWIHMVGTYDQTNTRFYVNGVQTGQSARTAADITNEFVKVIGRDGTDPNRYYNDQIAQPRIYNRALTASEVLNNFNATKDLYI